MTEPEAIAQLHRLADELEKLNVKLEAENAKMRGAILLLVDAVDAILPFVVTDAQAIERARRANEAARLTVISGT